MTPNVSSQNDSQNSVTLKVNSYQQYDSEEAIKDVVFIRDVTPPAEGSDLQDHLDYVIENEKPIDHLGETNIEPYEKYNQQTEQQNHSNKTIKTDFLYIYLRHLVFMSIKILEFERNQETKGRERQTHTERLYLLGLTAINR